MLTSKERSKIVNRGLDYEKAACEEAGCEHKGGPGNPDCICDSGLMEVKDTDRKLTKPQLMHYAKLGRKHIKSRGGFTKPALEYKKRYRSYMTLCDEEQCY